MQYRQDKRTGTELSALGFGCMRFPNNLGRIDKEKSEQLLLKAVADGINYFDTAYIYPGSEAAVGEIFEKHALREKVYIATKLPHTRCVQSYDFDKYFDEQRLRLKTGYIDYYLIHNFAELIQWERLCRIGIKDWIARKRESGEIRRIGFSFHGTLPEFKKLLDAYDWDFVQIQYNYINTNYQAGTKGLQYAAAKGLPVMIMEPLLGGKLSNLPSTAEGTLRKVRPERSPVAWALNWLWNQPEVTVVLSGMSDMAQLAENIRLADSAQPGMLTESDQTALQNAVAVFNDTYKIPCTGCNYCMPCPKGINIPDCFTAYNVSFVTGRVSGIMQYMTGTGIGSSNPHYASDCVNCGACMKKCPQNIKIPTELNRVRRRLQLPGLKTLVPWIISARGK